MSEFPQSELTPRQIVAELDRFIVGQQRAKKTVAIALRNRARRRLLEEGLREEVSPKNILMMGPTGVGKTEIARRLARLARAPFVKVEATKYTEVGYVGRDVESMVRDLVEVAIRLVREEKTDQFREALDEVVINRLLDLLDPVPHDVRTIRKMSNGRPEMEYELPRLASGQSEETHPSHKWWKRRELMKPALAAGRFDDREVEVKVKERMANPLGQMPMGGMGDMGGGGGYNPGMDQLNSFFEKMMPKKEKTVTLRVREARRVLFEEEIEELIDEEKIKIEAVERAQQDGIIFIDEFDKICGRPGAETRGPDVSREGVQRDILPIIEGCTVQTKHGFVATDHILFIAAGAFHTSKPSDLIPELQGRLPLRVELEALSASDFERILTEPSNSLTRQYSALLKTEGIELVWEPDGIQEIAKMAADVNASTENIGARRLHTILEKLLEDVSFEAPEMGGVGQIVINRGFVRQSLADVVKDQDLTRYIL